MLPASVIKTDKVELSGGWVEIRALSFNEVTTVQKLSGAAQNILAIAMSAGEDHDGVRDWYHSDSTAAGDVAKLCEAISALSGLDGAAQFPRPTGHDAVVEPTAT